MLRAKTLVSPTLRTLSPLVLLSSSTYSSSSCNKTRALLSPSLRSPPTPKKIPFTVAAHGRTWDDPYHWMRNTDDPDLRDHLDRENAYADAFMAEACGLRRQLAAEMRARVPATVATPPERWGPWYRSNPNPNPSFLFSILPLLALENMKAPTKYQV